MMYFPIFRGRQFELLALRECISNGVLSDKVVPIIEPVKASSTFVKTIESFIGEKKKVAIIRNPRVGSFVSEIRKENNQGILQVLEPLLRDENVVPALYVNRKFDSSIAYAKNHGISRNQLLLIFSDLDAISIYEKLFAGEQSLYNLIPDKREFRRSVHGNRVILEDHFPKQIRNADYSKYETEFFSTDHLYYEEDGYKGFSDYSVIGDDYSETGFAPYAVAIHIVYFDEQKSLRIAHFVSDSNDDISDPARKFQEAAGKLVEWNKNKHCETIGIRGIENAYTNKTYPGLGVIKKLSIMHHLELMSRFLDGVEL